MARISTPGHATKFSLTELTELIDLINDADKAGNSTARTKLKSLLRHALKTTRSDIQAVEIHLKEMRGE